MLRNLLMLFAGLLAMSNIYAAVYVYYPVNLTIDSDGYYYIGKVGVNHQIKIITSATDVNVENATVEVSNNRSWIYYVPTKTGELSICGTLDGHEVCFGFDVVERVLDTYADESVVILERHPSLVSVAVANRGNGITKVSVECSVCKTVEASVQAHELVRIDVPVEINIIGNVTVPFIIKDLKSGSTYTEYVNIVVEPSLKGRMLLPFDLPDMFTPILYPFRALLAVIAWMI